MEAEEYRIGPEEYVYYNFIQKSFEERRTFISDREHIDLVEKLNKARNQKYFDDKFETYKKYSKYYKRQVYIAFNKDAKTVSNLVDLLAELNKIIVKPIFGSCGQGIKIYPINRQNFKEQVN